MRLQPSHWLLTGAAGIMAVGTAGAALIAAQPPKYEGPNASDIRSIAQRVDAPRLGLDLIPAPSPAPAGPIRKPAARQSEPTRPAPPKVAAASPAPDTGPQPPDAAPEESAPSPQAITLIGVATEDGVDQAWLLNRESQERETASAGETAFGFTVKEVQPEAVRLARGGEEFTVYLGAAPVSGTPSALAGPAQSAEPQPGAQQAAAPTPPPANNPFTRDFRRNRGFGGSGSRAPGYRVSASSGRSRAYSRTRSQRTGAASGGNASFSSNSGGFPWWLMGSRSNNGSGQNSIVPTSNAQTARRNGAQLLSGTEPLPRLSSIRNPQTRRRTGRSSGRAFGQTASGTYSYYSINRRR